MGKQAEAITYAEASRGLNDGPNAVARVCEELLLSMGQAEEAYQRYAIAANQSTSYLATYRAIVRKISGQGAGRDSAQPHPAHAR